jgi:hypothetical protein
VVGALSAALRNKVSIIAGRHSGMFPAGIQALESIPDPGQMPAGVTMGVCGRNSRCLKAHLNSLKMRHRGLRRYDEREPGYLVLWRGPELTGG